MSGNDPGTPPYPPARKAWYMVGVLMVLYVLSFIDRGILGLLVDPIKREFGVSDTQVGLLQGLTFAVFYCALGIPAGWLVDRFSRRWIVAIGVFLWSLAATACGLAANFAHLVIARIGVGVGEATLSPAAYSLIGDAFPREKLGRAFGVYTIGITIGSGLALILGGLVVNAVSGQQTHHTLPLLGEVRSWQLVFVVTGLPGVLLCLLMFTFREPVRRGLVAVDGKAVDGKAAAVLPLRQSIAFVRERLDFFAPLLVAAGLLSIIGYGYFGWLPAALSRRFDVSMGDAGLVLGLVTLICNTIGILLSGRIADALAARGIQDAALRVCLGVALASTITGACTPLMPSITGSYGVLVLLGLTMSAYTGLVPLAISLVAPNQMRGQIGALYLLVNNLIGMGIGPVLVPFVSDHLIGDPSKVYLSLALVSLVSGLLAAALFAWIRPRYARCVAAASAWSTS